MGLNLGSQNLFVRIDRLVVYFFGHRLHVCFGFVDGKGCLLRITGRELVETLNVFDH